MVVVVLRMGCLPSDLLEGLPGPRVIAAGQLSLLLGN